jgi:hypothetical protein
MSWLEGIGYVASLLVFSTFSMKTMIPLRWSPSPATWPLLPMVLWPPVPSAHFASASPVSKRHAFAATPSPVSGYQESFGGGLLV